MRSNLPSSKVSGPETSTSNKWDRPSSEVPVPTAGAFDWIFLQVSGIFQLFFQFQNKQGIQLKTQESSIT